MRRPQLNPIWLPRILHTPERPISANWFKEQAGRYVLAGGRARIGRRVSTDRVTPCLLPYALLLQREPPLRGELDYQNQVRDHAADESDRPDKLLQQRLTSVNGIRRGFESPVVAGVHLAAQLLKAGMTYQARKARMARTVWLFGP